MSAPAFQFYAQDFLTGVMYLTNEEIGIYIKMLAKQWTDGKIPKKRLGFLVGINWEDLSEELQEKFADCGDYIINERLEMEREKQFSYRKKQSENGKKGGRPKKNGEIEEFEEEFEEENEKEESIDNVEDTETKKAKITQPFLKKKAKKSSSTEDEDEVEDEEEIEKEEENEKEEKTRAEKIQIGENRLVKKRQKPKAPPPREIVMPFDSDVFASIWQQWRDYKAKEHKFYYKSEQSEQAALVDLNNKAGGVEAVAMGIIRQSMANGWKGFFELKNENNGKVTGKTGREATGKDVDTASAFAKIDAMLGGYGAR